MLQNTKKIEHAGVISKIEDNCIYVSIMQSAACADCHAKTMCSLSEAKEKIIEIPYISGNYKVGEEVIVTGASSLGLMAVFYAFVIPLILIVSVLLLVIRLFESEILAVVLTIVSLIIYYAILYSLRGKMKKKFVFTLTKKL